ncbi:MAG: flippase [Acidobacteriota bacterium]
MKQISLGRVTTQLLTGRAFTYVLALANSVIIARTLGVELLGAYAYAMGIAALFGLLPNMGISTVVTRNISQDAGAGKSLIRAAVRAQALVSATLMILIPVFAWLLPAQPVRLTYVILAAAQLLVGTLSWPYLAVLGGHARYDRVALAELATATAGTTSLLVVAAMRGGVASFLTAHLLATVFAVGISRWICAPFLPPEEGKSVPLASLLRQSAPFGVTAALQSAYTRVDIVLLGQIATPVAVGLYNIAYKPTTMAVYFGATVAGALLPVMTRPPQVGTPDAFRKAMRGLGAMAPALALTLSGLAALLVIILYGPEYAPAAPVLAILAWSAAINWLYAPVSIALQARGKERMWLLAVLTGLLINLAGNLWAIPRWGARGAAGATLASELILLLIGVTLMARSLAIVPSLRPVLVGVSATVAGGGVLFVLRGNSAVLATLASLLVYTAILAVFRSVTLSDATTVVHWLRPSGLKNA